MGAGGLMKSDEKEKAGNKDGWVVGGVYDPCHEQHMNEGNSWGDRFFAPLGGIACKDEARFFSNVHEYEFFSKIDPVEPV